MDSQLYREHVIRTYEAPLNQGTLDPCDFSHEDDNPLCGDAIRIDVRLNSNNRVSEITWEGEGCIISQVSASLLTEKVKGMSLDEIQAISAEQMLEIFGAPVKSRSRIKCVMLSLTVLQTGAAIASAS